MASRPLEDFREYRKRFPPDQRGRETARIVGIVGVLTFAGVLFLVGVYAGLARIVERSPTDVARETAREEIAAAAVDEAALYRVVINVADGQLVPGTYRVTVLPSDPSSPHDAVWVVRRIEVPPTVGSGAPK